MSSRRPPGEDPVAFRLARLGKHPRHAAVLKLAADKAGWDQPFARQPGRGRGVAVHESFGTVVAQIAEVTVAGGKLTVDRVVCAVDCGIAVTPDVVRAQMQSGIGYGLSAALHGKITLTDGHVDQTNFHQYQVLRINEMPRLIEVYIVPSTNPPSGVGEPGTPPIAPAVANAIRAATGSAAALAAVRSFGAAQGLGAPRDPMSSGLRCSPAAGGESPRPRLPRLNGREGPGLGTPGGGLAERLRHRLGGIHDLPHEQVARIHEVFIDRALQHLHERREEPARVHQHDRVEVKTQALEGDRLEQFLERARTPGEGDRRLAQGEHRVLARPQILDELQIGQSPVTPLEVRHEARQYADHLPAGGERPVGERSHGARRAAAVDDRDAGPGQHLSQPVRGGAVVGVRGAARGAVHAHGTRRGRCGG